MEVSSVNSSYSNTSSTTSETLSSLDKDAFLLLLVEQLKNQDPTNPMDTSEFMGQMAQFTIVEQLINLNEEITTLNESMSQLILSQEMAEATGLLGKQVGIETEDGTVNGLVEKIVVSEEGIKVFVNGNSYDLVNVTEIMEAEQ